VTGERAALLCLACARQVFQFIGSFWLCACLAVIEGGQNGDIWADWGLRNCCFEVVFLAPRSPARDQATRLHACRLRDGAGVGKVC
jgi:hypothetical protein